MRYTASSIRFTPEDREILAELRALTGLDDSAAVIRLSIREELSRRQRRAAPPKKGRR